MRSLESIEGSDWAPRGAQFQDRRTAAPGDIGAGGPLWPGGPWERQALGLAWADDPQDAAKRAQAYERALHKAGLVSARRRRLATTSPGYPRSWAAQGGTRRTVLVFSNEGSV